MNCEDKIKRFIFNFRGNPILKDMTPFGTVLFEQS